MTDSGVIIIYNGVIIDVGTYNAIFQVLREMNCLDNKFKLLENIKEHACSPNDVTMDILTSWFSTEGKTTRLRNFVQDI
ncbi:hypothetical protein FRX31_012629 [Thalictrum thalictroides]|uniref:Pentatricopeptide repeat-containing protein n=1 Tax=Thalictrum thalictroides TaxID=46969 RepID=A0A7J6WK61_THATH|nr:hypothetical protein FRX31_012629 [Thalictrum thalictroides]